MRSQAHSRLTAFDCFAGCGGMSQGFKQAGYAVVGAIEIDKDSAAVYSRNHSNTKVWNEDIRRVSASRILRSLEIKKGELALLGGCPPCQGFSALRTYNGSRRVRDDRNDLIFEFERLVRGLRPRFVMLENVPGLLRNRRFKRFTKALRDEGYKVVADILNVLDYGVPQRRQRLVLLASRVSHVSFAPPEQTTSTVRSTIGGMPPAGASGDPIHDMPENRSQSVRERIRSIPADGGSRSALPYHLQLKCHKASDGFHDVYGRMAWSEPAPTITTGCFNPSKGRFLHPVEHRAITMREAALLQTFPASYHFSVQLGKIKIAKMIGNALPPLFIKKHAEHLLMDSVARR